MGGILHLKHLFKGKEEDDMKPIIYDDETYYPYYIANLSFIDDSNNYYHVSNCLIYSKILINDDSDNVLEAIREPNCLYPLFTVGTNTSVYVCKIRKDHDDYLLTDLTGNLDDRIYFNACIIYDYVNKSLLEV